MDGVGTSGCTFPLLSMAAIGWDVWAPGLIDRGILRPLDPYLADIGRPLERYFMNASVRAFRRFGRVWMLP